MFTALVLVDWFRRPRMTFHQRLRCPPRPSSGTAVVSLHAIDRCGTDLGRAQVGVVGVRNPAATRSANSAARPAAAVESRLPGHPCWLSFACDTHLIYMRGEVAETVILHADRELSINQRVATRFASEHNLAEPGGARTGVALNRLIDRQHQVRPPR